MRNQQRQEQLWNPQTTTRALVTAIATALIMMMASCVVSVQPDQAPAVVPETTLQTPKTAQVIPSSCPALVLPTLTSTHSEGPGSLWMCTSNCTQAPFQSIAFARSAPSGVSPFGVMLATSNLAVYDLLRVSFAVSYRQSDPLNPIVDGKIMLTSTGTSTTATTTSYPASIDCDQLTIGDAVFTYSSLSSNLFGY